MTTLRDRRSTKARLDRFAAYFFRLLALGLISWTILLVLGAHVQQGPRPRTYGGDFSLNIAGAVVMSHGGNPYDEAQIIATQDSYFARQGIATPHDRYTKLLTWQSYPPLFFWLLEPLIRIPFKVIGSIWVALLYLLMGLGCYCTLGFLGWRRRVVPTLLFLATPQVTLQAFSANPAAIAFAAIGCSLLLQRRYPILGGLVMSLTWIKLQVAVPAILLTALFHVVDRRRFLQGLVAGTAGLFAATVAATGIQPTLNWIKAIHGVSGIAGVQPNVVPLVGLYGGHVSAPMQTALEASLMLGALAITGAYWWRLRGQGPIRSLQVGWLWAVWLLALPYAHFPEEMLLTLPVLALVGKDACRLLHRESLVTLSLLFGSLLFFFWQPLGLNLLSLPVVALGLVLYREARTSGGAAVLAGQPRSSAAPA